MKAAILSVGTEILFGQITNTNTVFLSRELNHLGIDVMYHFTVGDNPVRVKEMIHRAFEDCDLVLTTGGLGPTQDDLTKEIACETLHDELVLHEEILEWLKNEVAKRGRKMTDNNIKQAYFPSRSVIFANPVGTAPGFALEENGKIIACMPGPPREMTKMFTDHVKPFLQSLSDDVIFYRLIRTIGIGESQLETDLLPLIDNQSDPTLATYAKEGEVTLRIASKRKTIEEAEKAVDDMLEKVKAISGDYIYSTNDEELADVVCAKLVENNITISSAESCTGGLFAGRLVDYPGISAVFERSFVTYSDRAKEEMLGVSADTLSKYSAVSEETAREMVLGLQKRTGSRLCVAVTGIAGPDGGTEEKPVGLVYTAVSFDGKVEVRKNLFRNIGRNWIRGRSVLAMFHLVYDTLNKNCI